MALTVRRLVRNPDLGLIVVAGYAGADRVIEWAHAIELADPAPWITGGELVMTTGLNIGSSDGERFDYVSRLVDADAVALAFDTGTTFERVPEAVLAAGDALGLPIIAVPQRTPFIAITHAVIDELTADRVRVVQGIVDQQEKLARATLRGGIPLLTATLGRALSATIVLIDAEGESLAAHGTDVPRAIEQARSVARSAGSTPGRGRSTSSVTSDRSGSCVVQSVSVAGDIRGYLAIGSSEPLETEDRLLVAHTVSLISIEMGKPAKVADAEQRLRTAVTEALLAIGADLDVGLLRFFGFTEESTVVAVVLTNVGALLPAQREMAAALAAQSVPYLMAPTHGDLAVIVGGDRDTAWVTGLVRTLSIALGRPVRAGRGDPVGVVDAATGVRQARAAARIGTATSSTVSDFADAGTFSLLLDGRSVEELSVLTRKVLGPLIDYDAATPSSPGLLSAVRVWLLHNAQMESAAAELGVHRHTMRSRIAKAADVLDRDLDSAEARAELWIAVKAHELAETLRRP